ncbi:hypothetical protein NEIRO03_0770 [Nematocida sp. AWRm78]|nr:hypothetical protein NEIRO03_0770 [Nematocida sp. AWRm78]
MVQCEEELIAKIEYWADVLDSEDIQEDLEQKLLDDLEYAMQQKSMGIDLLCILIDALPILNCPTIAVDNLVTLVHQGGRAAVHAFRGLLLLYTQYSIDIDMFNILYNLTTFELMRDETDLLLLLISDLLHSSNISILTIRMFVKKLMFMCMRSDLDIAYKILNVVGVICNRYKLNAGHAKNNKPNEYTMSTPLSDGTVDTYLYELDALKDHPILNIYIREIKQNKPVVITEKEINKKLLSIIEG